MIDYEITEKAKKGLKMEVFVSPHHTAFCTEKYLINKITYIV